MTGTVSPTSYQVVLLGREDKDPKTVHWSRMKRFAGTNFNVTERLVRTDVNDCQKFEVDHFVSWEGFGPQDDT